MDLQLTDKVALVTGGSRGIGRAVAAALLREGATVAIAARDRGRLDEAALDLGAASGRPVPALTVDTASDESVNHMREDVLRRLGRVDILVNAAARPAGQSKPPALQDIDDAAFWDDVNVKVMGYLRCARAFVPGMVTSGWGRVLNVAGLATFRTGSIIGSIRNVAVAALTKNLADELAGTGVNVVAVHPGITRTEATPRIVAQMSAAEDLSTEAIEARLGAATSLGRIVDAAEVAHVVAFLASPLAAAVNGDAVACGGGIRGAIYY